MLNAKWKKSIWNDSSYTTFWKKQNYAESKDEWLPDTWEEIGLNK